jgi:glycosyltransferase involved in cell wall biosynthesis
MQVQQKHIFFIASWLPSMHDVYEGDFIYRHAQAIALTHKVSAIYVIESEIAGNNEHKKVVRIDGNLSITIIYLNTKYKKFIGKNKYYKVIEQEYVACNKLQKIDIVHANIHWRAGYSAYRLFEKYKIPYIISEHSAYFNTDYYGQNSVANYSILKKYLVKKSMVNASFVLPVSAYLSQWILKFNPTIRTKIVSNVVADYFRNTENEKPIVKEKLFVFMHASMGWAEKNIGTIIDAAILLNAERKDFVLSLYIPFDKLHPRYNQLAFVTNYGNVSHAQMPEAFAKCDATILYSSMETQGCIVLESLAMGKPVIVGNAPVFAEMIEDAKNGYIATEINATALKNVMNKMIENYLTFERNKIAKKAIAMYGMQAICAQFSEVYDLVLRGK